MKKFRLLLSIILVIILIFTMTGCNPADTGGGDDNIDEIITPGDETGDNNSGGDETGDNNSGGDETEYSNVPKWKASGISQNREDIVTPTEDKEFSSLTSVQQEAAVEYSMFYKPESGFIGDLMPYYENGIFSLFYLKEEGGSVRHSTYRVDTRDFLKYTDAGETLRSGAAGKQDNWIGTGSVVKAEDNYYYFYTGHNKNLSPYEKVMVAKSTGNMDNFVKQNDFSIEGPASGFSRNDFRDPHAFYNEDTRTFDLIITTNNGTYPVLLRYSVSLDLGTATCEGVLYQFPQKISQSFYNLECADIFKIGSTYYLTFSGQDDTLWYAQSSQKFSGYGAPVRLDSKYFYAPKSVSDGTNTYMVGWARRRATANNSANPAWAGNIVVQKLKRNNDGSIVLVPIDGLDKYFVNRRALDFAEDTVSLPGTEYSNIPISNEYESYMLKGKFKFENQTDFGFAFGYSGNTNWSELKNIKICPSENKIKFFMFDGSSLVTEVAFQMTVNTTYDFTLIIEGSVGVFYIDNYAALTIRMYDETNKKFGFFSANNAVVFTNLRIYTRPSLTT